jgi:hypothetical protein
LIVYDQVADSRIVSISISVDASSAEFGFMNGISKIQWRLTVSGLKELTGWDIRKSNILDRIVVYSGEECTEDDILELVKAAQYGTGEFTRAPADQKNIKLLEDLKKGILSLISFDAAYGAEFLIIAEKIEFDVANTSS